MSDSVRHPSHYKLEGLNGIESIDIIKAVLGDDGFKKFCRGNTLKYLIRADKKNGLEDLKKAAVYLNWEITGGDEHSDEERPETGAEKAEKAEETGSSEEAVPLAEESEVCDDKTSEQEMQELPKEQDLHKEALHRRTEALAERHFARRGRSATWDVEKAKDLWAVGTSPEDICEEIGVNPKTFKTYRFRHPDAFPDQTIYDEA